MVGVGGLLFLINDSVQPWNPRLSGHKIEEKESPLIRQSMVFKLILDIKPRHFFFPSFESGVRVLDNFIWLLASGPNDQHFSLVQGMVRSIRGFQFPSEDECGHSIAFPTGGGCEVVTASPFCVQQGSMSTTSVVISNTR
jgi:hypothetical protein